MCYVSTPRSTLPVAWRIVVSAGSIAVGKAGDLVVLAGNPATNIDEAEKVAIVFKDGVGYDPAKLKRSVEGLLGLR